MYFKLTAENIPFLTKTHLTYRRIYSVTHLYENIAIIRYKESFFQTKSIIQPPINVLWATFSLCFNFLSGEPFGPDSQKYLIFREKMQFSKIRILNND